MTSLVKTNTRLSDIINKNNINIDFLKSDINNEVYFTSDFNYENLLWKFSNSYESYYHLLIQSKSELMKLRVVGKKTINELEQFLSTHNCEIGMFEKFNRNDFYSITGDKVRISELSHTEMMIGMLSMKYFVDSTPNDYDLGRILRKIFNTTKV